MVRKKIDGKNLISDVRAGKSRAWLRAKYELSEEGLSKAFTKLIDRGRLTQSDVDACTWSVPVTNDVWICPACERPQAVEWEVCPICGVIVEKYEPVAKVAPLIVETEEEISSIGQFTSVVRNNFTALYRDNTFRAVCVFACIPLMLCAVQMKIQIVFLCALTGLAWSAFFKTYVIRDTAGWTKPMAGMCFTGFTGVAILLMFYCGMPKWYMAWAQSSDSMASLKGYVLQVGICEELCKIVPALFYVLWKKAKTEQIQPRIVVTIAVFSAVGFAVIENVGYAHRSISYVTRHAQTASADTVAVGAQGAMINYLVRAVSLTFIHAVFSGIFGCFLAMSVFARRSWPLLFLVGLGLSSGMHGLYDWLVTRSMILAALLDCSAGMLFYTLVARPARTVQNYEESH